MKLFKIMIFVALSFPAMIFANAPLKDWSLRIDFNKFAAEHFKGKAYSKDYPLGAHTFQIQYSAPETLIENGRKLEVQHAKITFIGGMGTKIADRLADKIKPHLPEPGCNDSNNVIGSRYERNGGTIDQRYNNNKGIRFFASAYGQERACDWPHTKYGSWRKDFWINLEMLVNNGILSIRPSIETSQTTTSISSISRITSDIVGFINDIGKELGIHIDIPDPDKLAENADNLIGYEIAHINNLLAGKSLQLKSKGFFSKSGEGIKILSNFEWSDKSGFSKYMLNFPCSRNSRITSFYESYLIFSTKTKRSTTALKMLDTELRKYMSNYSKDKQVKFAHAVPFVDRIDTNRKCPSHIQEELNRKKGTQLK